jgi:serine/threonine protein kinase
MAPEQVAGSGADRRTDVWGLGVTLYEALSLQPPFAGPTREAVFDDIRRAHPPALRSLNPSVSRDLEAVVQKAIERDPARRYPDMPSLAADLECVLAGRPPGARRGSALKRVVRAAHAHRVPASVLLVAVLVIAALCVWLWIALSRRS